MPNWVDNVLDVSGASVEAFRAKVKSKESDLDFMTTVPRPSVEDANWYNWNIANWGTKWNNNKEVDIEEINDTLQFRFNTAWSPPYAWLEETAKLFKDLTFVLTWLEEDFSQGKITVWHEEDKFKFNEEEVSRHDIKYQIDENYREQYDAIVNDDYDEMVETYSDSDYDVDYELEVPLIKRIKDEDLHRFKDREWCCDEVGDIYKIRTTPKKDLPLLVNEKFSDEAQKIFEEKLNG